jgi:hypothetical protein
VHVCMCVCVVVVCGSAGDADYSFRHCVRHCLDHDNSLPHSLTHSTSDSSSSSSSGSNSGTDHSPYYDIYLRDILQWDRVSECEYSCMRSISENRIENNLPVLKYFGHWPYYRVLGLQEPASALFSLLNALPHVYHISYNRHHISEILRYWIVSYGIMATIAWICSTIFHSRKVPITIFLDYSSALMFLVFGLFVAIRRTLHYSLFRLYPLLSFTLFTGMALVCLSRVCGMYEGRIGFDNHMTFSICVAVAHTAVWIMWLIASPRESKSHKLQCLFLQLWFIAASMLELFDFPPIWYHFDAHSLWHLTTIPLGHLWYKFWFQDAIVMKKLEAEMKKVA